MRGAVPLSLMHEFEGLIDVSEGHSVRDKLIDLQLACQVVLHQTRHILTTLPAWVGRGGFVELQSKSWELASFKGLSMVKVAAKGILG